jgi:hypothetical protein
MSRHTVVTCNVCEQRCSTFHATRIRFARQPMPYQDLDVCSSCVVPLLRAVGLHVPDPEQPTHQHQHQAVEPAHGGGMPPTNPPRTLSHQAIIIKPSKLNGVSHHAVVSEPSND